MKGKGFEFLDAGLGVAVIAGAMAMALAVLVGPVTQSFGGPVLVLAPPWGGGALDVVRAAGGSPIGPEAAPFAVLASFPDGTQPADLAALGAWAVRDGSVLSSLCGITG